MSQHPPRDGWTDPRAPSSGGWPDQPAAAPDPGFGQPATDWTDPSPTRPENTAPVAPGAPAPLYPGTAYGTPAAAPPGYGYPTYPAPAPKTNGLSVAALVVSCVAAVGLVCYGLGGILGVVGAVLGHLSRRQIRDRREAGDGMALAGIIVGWIAFGIGVLAVIGWIAFIVFVSRSPEFATALGQPS